MTERKRQVSSVFEEASIPKAVMTLAVPTIITQLINIVYNLADTWYVGRTGNPAMVAALSVSMPVFILMSALANLFGVGGASAVSRSLGMKNEKKARHVFAFCIYGGLCAALLFAAVIACTRSRLIPLIGADESSFGYVYDYMFWTMIIGSVSTVGNVLCGHLVRSIGAAKQAGLGMSMGGILNMILDPLFMFVILPKGQEVTGAAIATMLSNTAALIYFIHYILKHRDNPVLTLDPKDVSLKERIPSEVLLIGLPAALSTTLSMVSNIFANALVSEYGSAAVAGMGVAKKVNTLAFNTTMGLTQGVLPFIGYTYGARQYKRMSEGIRFTGIMAMSFCLTCTVVFRVFSSGWISIFIQEENSVRWGTEFMNVLAFAAPLSAGTYLLNTIFQATGRKVQSLMLSVMRKGVLDIPLMFLFKSAVGVKGVVIATPVAEAFSVCFGLIMYFSMRKKLLSLDQS